MKKKIKAVILMLIVIAFVVLVTYGIITSMAALSSPTPNSRYSDNTTKIYDNTEASTMLDLLKNGENLTNISNSTRDKNKYLYCRERYWALYKDGHYWLKNGTGNPTDLPGNASNGYAKSYILVAGEYTKSDNNTNKVSATDERQWAWYFILGYNTGKANDLYNIAMDYQKYKESEVKTSVSNSSATTTINNKQSIYGPIKVNYSYKKSTSGSKSDEWGGFNYAFFDGDTNISTKVQLCTLSNGKYTEITSSKNTNGYYEVRTDEYNNKNLYVVTSDTSVSTATLKIQENKVDYKAKIYEIEGQHYRSDADFTLCQDCKSDRDEAVDDMYKAMNENKLWKNNGKYYKFVKIQTETDYVSNKNKGWNYCRLYDYNKNTKKISTTATDVRLDKIEDDAAYSEVKYCKSCKSYNCRELHFQKHSCENEDGTICHYNEYQCVICHNDPNKCANSDDGDNNHYDGKCVYDTIVAVTNHIAKEHKIAMYKYTKTVYVFKEFTGCGGDRGEKISDCGTYLEEGYYNSQGLHIVESKSTTSSNEIILDTNIEFLASVQVKKEWLDGNNTYKTRPSEIEVKLLANGKDTGKRLKLNQSNNWTGKFEELDIKDSNNKEIKYTIQEISVEGYEVTITGDAKKGYTITNILKTEVTVKKEWKDENDLDEYRKNPLIVTLYANGKSTGKTVSLSDSNNWTAKFTGICKYDTSGNLIDYTVQEENLDKYTNETNKSENADGYITYTITNTHTPVYAGYTEITGKVWLDQPDGKGNDINGVLDGSEKGLSGIKVTLKDSSGKQFDATSTTTTAEDGTYVIKVNYDNSKNVYKLYENSETVKEKLKTAYIEFEYDGMKYTTVSTSATGANTSKAVENETTRNKIDSTYTTITKSTTTPETWTNTGITATTKNVISFENYADKTNTKREEVLKYCNGNGTYIRTNPENAWNNIITQNHTCQNCSGTGHTMRTYGIDVETIQNVNLGLFEREQPDVAIFSDLTKVKLTTNGQSYTYLYGVRGDASKDVGVKVKFQNKDTYTYKRPVNPADIAYIQQKANNDKMSLQVTYEVKVANLSTTLTTTIHSIANYFDNRYVLSKSGWTVKTGSDYNKATNNSDLDITLKPQTESSAIEFTYDVTTDTIRSIFNQEATLNNAVEIESYSTIYGEKTLYAEQRTGGRTNQPYGGYDYNSHPGNANIQLKTGEDGVKRLYSTDANGNIISTNKMEDDTDIAPSFVLCKDEEENKTLSGTVWEDTDDDTSDDERLGNGRFDNGEKLVQNVKVELYKIDGTIAKLYDTNGNSKDAVVYTDSNGRYAFEGVVTDVYYLKYTYGDDETSLKNGATTINGVKTPINARNYKSTIITDETVKNVLKDTYNDSTFNKKWHITHQTGYSVAVDDMEERLKIDDLYNANFDETLNMVAYTRPFELQVEYDYNESSKIEVSDSEKDNKVIEGNLSFSNDLSKMDFGIIERPRENLYTQKTISYVKVKLANGQVLTEGDPRTQSLSYIKAMGFGQVINNSKDARKAIEKQLLIEVDSELIQGAQIEVSYEVTVTNDNEKDYDYGTMNYYLDLTDSNRITTSPGANYYYYGKSEGLTELKATLEFVDYLDNELVYNEEKNTDWTTKNISDLKNSGLVSAEVESYMKQKDYKVLQSSSEESITLKRGETSTPLKMTVSKLLTSQAENVYTNGVEIIKIDSKTARTIHETKDGTQVEKTYKPGNYLPTTENFEQDEDRVKVIITPPTGITNYIITYVITGLVGLIIIGVGIIFIKKKVVDK